MGGRNILVPPKPAYPTPGQTLTPLGRPVGSVKLSAAERRRRNLTFLAAFNIITFVIGLLPPLRFLLIPHLLGDVLLIAYLGLAVYMTSFAPSRERQRAAPAEVVAPQRVAEGGA